MLKPLVVYSFSSNLLKWHFGLLIPLKCKKSFNIYCLIPFTSKILKFKKQFKPLHDKGLLLNRSCTGIKPLHDKPVLFWTNETDKEEQLLHIVSSIVWRWQLKDFSGDFYLYCNSFLICRIIFLNNFNSKYHSTL